MVKQKLKMVFDTSIEIVFGIILLFLVIGISIGAIQLTKDLFTLFKLGGITGHYIGLISDVLTLYVLVELSRSLFEYFDTHKFRLVFIVDAAIIFVIREILIAIFKHDLQPSMVYALSLLVLILGIIRTGSVVTYQQEIKMFESFKKEQDT